MELQMPVLGGIKAARHIRNIFTDLCAVDVSMKKPLLIASTADAKQYHDDELEAFDAYIQKPYMPDDLVGKIRELLARGAIEMPRSGLG